MTQATGRFTEKTMTRTMTAIATQLDLDTHDARLLRLTNNAVFALPAAGVVIRIGRSRALGARVAKVVQLGGWFEEVDAPTIRLAPHIEQPITIEGLTASIWQYVPAADTALTPSDLGQVLREFHANGTPPFPLPQWDPVGDARTRITDAEALSERDRHTLLTWCDALQPRVNDLRERQGGHLIHGDAHVGNLLQTPNGRVLLCDFDATTIGPRQVDLAAVAVGEIRFRRSGTHAELAASYGHDVTTDPDWPTLRDARELKMIAAAVPLLASTPGVPDEFALRLRSITDNDQSAWTPFADLRR